MESTEEMLVDLPCDFCSRRVEGPAARARRSYRKFEGTITLIPFGLLLADATLAKHCAQTDRGMLTIFGTEMPKDLFYNVQPSGGPKFDDFDARMNGPWRAYGAPKADFF